MLEDFIANAEKLGRKMIDDANVEEAELTVISDAINNLLDKELSEKLENLD